MSLNMRSIFRCMMEYGYYPTFEKTHIQFEICDNTAVVEYEEGVVSVRLFFTIDEEIYEIFLEASNLAMIETYIVKPVVLEDMKNIMFSCEILCDTVHEFRKFLPKAIDLLKDALAAHQSKMKRLMLASEVLSKTIPATEEPAAGIGKRNKLLS